MEKLIGRLPEKALLQEIKDSGRPELVAVYGRKGVGKTFLIKEVYKNNLLFEFTGTPGAGWRQQLENFSRALQKAADSPVPLEVPMDWFKAFWQLEHFLVPRLKKKGPFILLFDELPWMQTPKSRFLDAFGYFWNSFASARDNLIVVIAGSDVSWMTGNILHNTGGMYNRVTRSISLSPFTLHETETYLKSRHVTADRHQVLYLYMVMGGIPQYLKEMNAGESVAQNIDRICFSKKGNLHDEFSLLYHGLFGHAAGPVAILKALAYPTHGHTHGLTRKQIITRSGVTSGGTTTRLLKELEESGLITGRIFFGKRVKETIYHLSDEFSLFYLSFMEGGRSAGKGTWNRHSKGETWKSWSDMAFGAVCQRHIPQIKRALGIGGVITSTFAWQYEGDAYQPGAQIDLLIKRMDRLINVCVFHYSHAPITLEKTYADELKNKLHAFRGNAEIRGPLLLTLITTCGVNKNIYYFGLVENEVRMEPLFEP